MLGAQENQTQASDSVSAISPNYMPVSFCKIEPHLFNLLEYREVDTTIDKTHFFDPLMFTENIYQSLGITGQAHQSINFDFIHDRGFTYMQLPYNLYYKKQNDLAFYEVKTSFTKLAYTFGLPKENAIDVTHAQYFRGVTAVFDLHSYSNPGYFLHQATANFVGDIQLKYEIPSKVYGFRVAYIFNRFSNEENGGLSDFTDDKSNIYDYEDFLQQNADNLQGYSVNSEYATGKVVSHDLLFQQYVNIKTGKNRYLGTLTHTLQYRNFKITYFDTELDSLYYDTYNFSADTTNDSIQYLSVVNTLQWSSFSPFEKISDKNNFIHFAGGLMHEYSENRLYKYFGNTFTLFAGTQIRLFAVMDIAGQISYSFMGYNDNDAIANAKVTWAINRKHAHYIGIESAYYRISPDYIYSYYSGNHNYWDTSWSKQNILTLSAYWTRTKYKVAFNYYMLHDYLIFDENKQPLPITNFVSIFQLNLYAPFRIKNFGLDANIYLQYADNQFIQVPVFAGKASTFYIFNMFKNKLQLQLGFDMMYNTSYYANAYDPVIHQFYYQNYFKTGNYFYLDANISIKVKRINIFFRVGHVLSGLMGYNYFTTPYYPMTDRKFAVGVKWRFYD
jgi:hypothetical protein